MNNPYADIVSVRESVCTPAQEALKSALVKLLNDNRMQQITVKELCRHAFIARSTFYAYYNSIDEVLEDIEDDMIGKLANMNRELMDREIREIDEMRFYSETLSLIDNNKTTFYMLLVSNPDHRFINKWKYAMKYHFWERIQPTKSMKNVELILEITASAAIGAYTFWMEHPYEVDQEGTYRILYDLLYTIDKMK